MSGCGSDCFICLSARRGVCAGAASPSRAMSRRCCSSTASACHRPGQAAPFSLLTYEDVRPRAKRIAEVTRDSRRCRPWKPEPGPWTIPGRPAHGECGNRQVFRQWVAQGMMRGDAADLPPIPRFADAWQLGTPDVVVQMPEAYVLPAQRRDVFRTFVIPIPVERACVRQGGRISPGQHEGRASRQYQNRLGRGSRGVATMTSRAPGTKEAAAARPDFPDGMFLGWTPGQSPRASLRRA